MKPPLVVDLSINNGPIQRAEGWDTYTLLESIGYHAFGFREKGNLITSWKWVHSANGEITSESPTQPKKRSVSRERQAKQEAEQKRMEEWVLGKRIR